MEPPVAANVASISAAKRSRGPLIASWIITGLTAVFLLLDVAMKFAPPKSVAAAFVRAGWPIGLSSTLGVLLLVSLILWLIPRSAPLGAILLTGYLGGAVSSNLRLQMPLFTITLAPVYFGALVWFTLWLRDPRLRTLLPFRAKP